jgi:uncharacterized protein (TIGR02145 family)
MRKDSISSQLEELFELHQSGAIEKEEFEKLKQGILYGSKTLNSVAQKSREHATPVISKKSYRENRGKTNWVLPVLAGIGLLVSLWFFRPFQSSERPGAKPEKRITVYDVEGNLYNAVVIGTQVWMAENLRTTKFNDGTPIPLVTNDRSWSSLSTPAYCWYDNDEASNMGTYGALYNWYAVDSKKLCPAGWRVPTDHDWNNLKSYIYQNGHRYKDIGGTGKALAAKTSWNANPVEGYVGNDPGSNNSTGFSALAAGNRFIHGNFESMGTGGFFWSANSVGRPDGSYFALGNNSPDLFSFWINKGVGMSVRCISEEEAYGR